MPDATPNDLAAPPPDRTGDPGEGPSQGTIAYLARLQGDGRLMLRYLMEQPKRSTIPAAEDPAAGITPAILFDQPARLAGDAGRTTQLIRYVDFLSRTADPVSLATVRETYRFLGQDQDLNGSTTLRRRLVYALSWLRDKKGVAVASALGLCLLVLSIYFLVQVDDGRRTMQQLATIRADVTAVYNDLGKVEAPPNWVIHLASRPFPPAAGPGALPATPAPFIPFCTPALPTPRVASDAGAADAIEAAYLRIAAEQSWRIPATPQADLLCARLGEIRLREALVFIRLTAWNERLSRVAKLMSRPPFSLD